VDLGAITVCETDVRTSLYRLVPSEKIRIKHEATKMRETLPTSEQQLGVVSC